VNQGIFWRGRFWVIAGGDEGDGQQEPPNTGNGTGQQGGDAQQQNAGDGEKRFTQAELDAVVADRLKRATESAERKAASERQKADERAAAEQGQFKELAEQRQTRIAELEPFEAKATRYEAALTSLLDVQRKDLPKHITALLDKLDAAEQLEWIAANQEALKVPAAGTTAVPGTPRPNGQTQTQADLIEKTKDELRASGRYARF
jgi:hypothetical protein